MKMTDDEFGYNIHLAVNFLVSLLKSRQRVWTGTSWERPSTCTKTAFYVLVTCHFIDLVTSTSLRV